jgi:hypothetical protein
MPTQNAPSTASPTRIRRADRSLPTSPPTRTAPIFSATSVGRVGQPRPAHSGATSAANDGKPSAPRPRGAHAFSSRARFVSPAPRSASATLLLRMLGLGALERRLAAHSASQRALLHSPSSVPTALCRPVSWRPGRRVDVRRCGGRRMTVLRMPLCGATGAGPTVSARQRRKAAAASARSPARVSGERKRPVSSVAAEVGWKRASDVGGFTDEPKCAGGGSAIVGSSGASAAMSASSNADGAGGP